MCAPIRGHTSPHHSDSVGKRSEYASHLVRIGFPRGGGSGGGGVAQADVCRMSVTDFGRSRAGYRSAGPWPPKKGAHGSEFEGSPSLLRRLSGIRGPDVIRQIGPGRRTSAPQPKPEQETQNIVEIRALSALSRAKIRLIELRAHFTESTEQIRPRDMLAPRRENDE